jgi:hypothetical protein
LASKLLQTTRVPIALRIWLLPSSCLWGLLVSPCAGIPLLCALCISALSSLSTGRAYAALPLAYSLPAEAYLPRCAEINRIWAPARSCSPRLESEEETTPGLRTVGPLQVQGSVRDERNGSIAHRRMDFALINPVHERNFAGLSSSSMA